MRLVFDNGELREFHAKTPPTAAAKGTLALDIDAPDHLVAAMRRAVSRGRVSTLDGALALDGKAFSAPDPAKPLTYAEAVALADKASAQLRPLLRLLVDELLRQGVIEL